MTAAAVMVGWIRYEKKRDFSAFHYPVVVGTLAGFSGIAPPITSIKI
jgi:hypothetical protein